MILIFILCMLTAFYVAHEQVFVEKAKRRTKVLLLNGICGLVYAAVAFWVIFVLTPGPIRQGFANFVLMFATIGMNCAVFGLSIASIAQALPEEKK